jgi:hypothetical protein
MFSLAFTETLVFSHVVVCGKKPRYIIECNNINNIRMVYRGYTEGIQMVYSIIPLR